MKPSLETTMPAAPSDPVLISMVSRLLRPAARLCLALGVTFAAMEDALKRAFVHEADALEPDAPAYGAVSRISTATGISRREVTRLMREEAPGRPTKAPLASEVFTRWVSDPALKDEKGAPRSLKRQGDAPSFEALAHSITRDVHPRSMLDELVRLGLVQVDEENDTVTLLRRSFVPQGDSRQMLGFLGDNVGDHLEAAVANIIDDRPRHLEQAVFADELSAESIEALRPLLMARWQAFRDDMVPVLVELIEADRAAGRVQDQRVRIGLYGFSEAMKSEIPDTNPPAQQPSKRSASI